MKVMMNYEYYQVTDYHCMLSLAYQVLRTW